jgi:hypothetical protein
VIVGEFGLRGGRVFGVGTACRDIRRIDLRNLCNRFELPGFFIHLAAHQCTKGTGSVRAILTGCGPTRIAGWQCFRRCRRKVCGTGAGCRFERHDLCHWPTFLSPEASSLNEQGY